MIDHEVKRMRGCPGTALTLGRIITLTQKPEESDAQQNSGRGSDDEAIREALQLLADFDNTPLPDMTPLFYQHGYEELRMITRDLLQILGYDPDAQTSS